MYGIYYSIATHGTLAQRSALKTHIQKFLNLHKKIIKVIASDENNIINLPLNIRQKFILQSLSHRYLQLQNKYLNSTQITRSKSLKLPSMSKET